MAVQGHVGDDGGAGHAAPSGREGMRASTGAEPSAAHRRVATHDLTPAAGVLAPHVTREG